MFLKKDENINKDVNVLRIVNSLKDRLTLFEKYVVITVSFQFLGGKQIFCLSYKHCSTCIIELFPGILQRDISLHTRNSKQFIRTQMDGNPGFDKNLCRYETF